MPELPEVETVRRMLEGAVRGRRIARVAISGKALHGRVPRELPRALRGRTIERLRRHGKFLLIELSGGVTLISHLGMSGRWLYHARPPRTRPPHLHARIVLADGGELWFEDARRFGMLRAVASDAVERDPSLAPLGPDPIAQPPTGASLARAARGSRVAVKTWLLDQKRIAGVGNIYASEILHRAGVDPRAKARALSAAAWARVAAETTHVLDEAIARAGTTFSMYRTVWGEPGSFGGLLRVYDRAGEPCRNCGAPIRRIVQGQRSTYFCPACQGRAAEAAGGRPARRPGPRPA
ncbi:MAG TPA: bifunctional DNA-formamidopyrimidine glycosylase/DNA-(apurinic or apyrimidinic site) lyase, partial [Candidatus Eisenbacteria bacterium]|nr:bifunctional DNA-formamidopyrimidine glycosylase/DNA-(apurinic or apyrimidinic site) lyase [Candidatus Eisenbacteria bacterium]